MWQQAVSKLSFIFFALIYGTLATTSNEEDSPLNGNRVALFTVYQLSSGQQLPPYMNYLAESCAWQSKHTDCFIYVILSDSAAETYKSRPTASIFMCREATESLPSNVFVSIIGFTAWTNLMMKTTKIRAQPLNNHNKQIDYKVIYGSLFEDTILHETKYSHFGWMDPDILLGDVNLFMEDWRWDIFTTYYGGGYQDGTMSGQLTIFRNNQKYRHLWESIPELRGKLNSPYEYGSDERVLGEYVFNQFKKGSFFRFSHDQHSFTLFNHGVAGELYFYRGHLYNTDICKYRSIKLKEGVLLHFNHFKHHATTCEAFSGVLHGWNLDRWNISTSSFHDPSWGLVTANTLDRCAQNAPSAGRPSGPGFWERWRKVFNYWD